jgi:hypothetical protein
MKPAEYHPLARREQARAVVRYADIDPNIAQDFRAELNRFLSQARAQPLFFPIETRDVRRCVLACFPYSIIYRDLPSCVWVIAVAHHSRDPRYWLRRRRNP